MSHPGELGEPAGNFMQPLAAGLRFPQSLQADQAMIGMLVLPALTQAHVAAVFATPGKETAALPGAQKSLSQSGEAAIAQQSACSRPPEPTTRMRMETLVPDGSS